MNEQEANIRGYAAKTYEEEWSDTVKRLDLAGGFAQSLLKALFLVNGAGIVSLLTFLGNSEAEYEKVAVFWSFVWLSGGLIAILIGHLAAYFCQVYYMNSSFSEAVKSKASAHGLAEPDVDSTDWYKKGTFWEYLGVASAVASLTFFIVGSFVALDAIT